MKFFALLAALSVAIAAPIADLEARQLPGAAPATTTGPTKECWARQCGGPPGIKRDQEVKREEVVVIKREEPIVERQLPGAAPATTTGPTKECWARQCGGPPGIKREEPVVEKKREEPVVEKKREEPIVERQLPGAAPATTTGPTKACWARQCGGPPGI